ncbi:hypothetical protein SteCoe_13471 [Stentor coeruleus]|uniref:RBR-type E3 ubiquitin transferase n=1 Tax=Stentor coeruleus TaxID=5963 RepID=A0A1R2C8F0_9CILI|nr:hypothetical protein SteCoe_13471 [Stentor coeruleus]
MYIFDILQEDFPMLGDLPALSKCKSIEYEAFEPLILKRGQSENSISALNAINFDNIFLRPKPQPENEEFFFFPLVDLTGTFDEDPSNDYPNNKIQEKLIENVQNENNYIINNQENNIFDIDIMFNEEFIIPQPIVLNQPIAHIQEINDDIGDFFGGFNIDIDEPIVNNYPARNRPPRPPRPQRVRPQKDEPCHIEIFSLFSDIEYLDRDQYYLDQLKNAAFYELEVFDPYSIRCEICTLKSTDYHAFQCKHSYCVSCLKLLMQSYLESAKVLPEDIVCPSCNAAISDNEAFKFLDSSNYQKFLDTRYQIKAQTLCAQGKAVACPVPDCPGYAHLIANEKITACNKCKCTLCCQCKGPVHPGMTCEENLKISRDSSLEQLILSQNWKRCPTCGVPVEKLDGCQFLYCDSKICRGRNNLCYICGRFVVESQHFSHYKTKGPFGDTCNTLDGLPEDIDSTQIAPIIENDEQPVENQGNVNEQEVEWVPAEDILRNNVVENAVVENPVIENAVVNNVVDKQKDNKVLEDEYDPFNLFMEDKQEEKVLEVIVEEKKEEEKVVVVVEREIEEDNWFCPEMFLIGNEDEANDLNVCAVNVVEKIDEPLSFENHIENINIDEDASYVLHPIDLWLPDIPL